MTDSDGSRVGRALRLVSLALVAFVALTAEVCLTNGTTTTKARMDDGVLWSGLWCSGSDVSGAADFTCPNLDSRTAASSRRSRLLSDRRSRRAPAYRGL